MKDEGGLTLAECAAFVGGELVGSAAPQTMVRGVNDIALAGPDELAFVARPTMAGPVQASRAAAVLVPPGLACEDRPLIRVADPLLAATLLHRRLLQRPFVARGVHPTAHTGAGCRIPAAVTVMAGAVLGDRVRLGERVVIGAGTVVGDGVEIGDDTVLHANVTVYAGTVIGRRVEIHAGTVVGSDGYGYVADAEGRHCKRPHVGRVVIEDDVEIGANCCVDRATFGETRIGRGTKIDNLVQVAHNVTIGPDCLLVAQVGIAGSVRLGRQVVLGGNVGVAGHVELGDRVMVAAKSGVHSSVPPGSRLGGYPAVLHERWLRSCAVFSRLPELARDLRALKRRLDGDRQQEEG